MEKGSGQAAVTSRLWDYQCPFVAVLEQRETLCCQKGERKKEEKKKTTHNLARGMLLLQKKKTQIPDQKGLLKDSTYASSRGFQIFMVCYIFNL